MNRPIETWTVVGVLALFGCTTSDAADGGDTGAETDAQGGTQTEGGGGGTATWTADTAGGGESTIGTTASPLCTPGDVAGCSCPDGGEGSQSCMPDGTDFFPCFCGGTDGNADATAGDTTDTGGGTSTSATSGGVVGSVPVAAIQHPSTGEDRPVNMNIPFDGTGLDEEDGILMGPALVWTSDIEGEIGTGANIQVPLTMLGLHEITLTATDNDGNDGVASIFVNIIP